MIILLISLLSFQSQASTLKVGEGQSYKFIELNNMKVSPQCKKSCDALKNYQDKAKTYKKNRGNPASEFCDYVGGKDLIGSYESLDQDSICVFKDKSYILSWDLYYKNFQVKNKK